MKLTKTSYLVAFVDLVNFLQVSLIPAEEFHILLSNGAAYAMASLNGVEPRGEKSSVADCSKCSRLIKSLIWLFWRAELNIFISSLQKGKQNKKSSAVDWKRLIRLFWWAEFHIFISSLQKGKPNFNICMYYYNAKRDIFFFLNSPLLFYKTQPRNTTLLFVHIEMIGHNRCLVPANSVSVQVCYIIHWKQQH